MRSITILVLSLLLAVHGLAWGDCDDRDDGIAAAQRGDYDTAMREWRSLAEQGYIEAQYNLGVMYDKGYGVSQDYVQAYMWYNIASVNGLELAGKNRDGVAQLITPAQIAEAQKLAREWMEKHP